MSITVHTPAARFLHPAGTKWHIDDFLCLHVMDGSGKHIAAYARDQWASVEQGDK